MFETERPNQGEWKRDLPKNYSLRDISRAITEAREVILGISLEEGSSYIKNYKKGIDSRIYMKVLTAEQKARKESGKYWTQKRTPPFETRYDGDHTVGILEALESSAVGKRRRDFQELGITGPVLRRAEEILFGIPANQS